MIHLGSCQFAGHSQEYKVLTLLQTEGVGCFLGWLQMHCCHGRTVPRVLHARMLCYLFCTVFLREEHKKFVSHKEVAFKTMTVLCSDALRSSLSLLHLLYQKSALPKKECFSRTSLKSLISLRDFCCTVLGQISVALLMLNSGQAGWNAGLLSAFCSIQHPSAHIHITVLFSPADCSLEGLLELRTQPLACMSCVFEAQALFLFNMHMCMEGKSSFTASVQRANLLGLHYQILEMTVSFVKIDIDT